MKKGFTSILGVLFGVCVTLTILLINTFVNPFLFASDDYKQAKKIQSLAESNIYFERSNDNSGASEAPITSKGGAVYLEEGARYNHKGGVINNHNATYGGAIYVSSGAVFTMTGGALRNNSASYGGAIYIEAGGVVNLEAGTIFNNTITEYGIDIYLEDGAELNISDNFIIARNSNDLIEMISDDTVKVGQKNKGIDMHYINYGSYPQTYVGNDLNTELEAWYQAKNPEVIKTYVTRQKPGYPGTGVWNSYMYVDGGLYARGLCNNYSEDYVYISGEAVVATNNIAWFKVEPLKWVILNYEDIVNNNTSVIDVLSYDVIASNIYVWESTSITDFNMWYTTYMRNWLNNEFYNSAFSNVEKTKIELTNVKNNVVGNYNNDASDGTGVTSQDYVYNLSYYDCNSRYFATDKQRICSPTDFAVSNFCTKFIVSGYETETYVNGGTCYWYTRSTGANENSMCFVHYQGSCWCNSYDNDARGGMRPAMSLRIDLINRISEDTIMVGDVNNGKRMHYMEYGTYPQSYVGNTMNTTLESWYQSSNPSIVRTYTTYVIGNNGVWSCYKYTDGKYYVRGYSLRNYANDDFLYTSGEAIPVNDSIVWFKVESLKWIVLNYDSIINQETDEIRLLTLNTLVCYRYMTDITGKVINWQNSDMRYWLNNEFYQNAFNSSEKNRIKLTTVNNNIAGDFKTELSDTKGIQTLDYVYILSYYEAKAVYFSTNAERYCSPTDFGLSNNVWKSSKYKTITFPNGGTSTWWTRSANTVESYAPYIYSTGVLTDADGDDNYGDGLRPVINLII